MVRKEKVRGRRLGSSPKVTGIPGDLHKSTVLVENRQARCKWV